MSVVKKIIIGLLTLVLSSMLIMNLVLVVYLTTVKGTLMNPAFLERELERIDAYSLGKEKLAEERDRFVGELGAEGERVYQIIEASLTDEWLKEQVHEMLGSLFSYLNYKTDTLKFQVSTAALKENMKTELKETILTSPPPGLQELSLQELERYLESAYQGIDNLPGELGIEIENLQALNPLRDIIKAFYLITSLLLLTAVISALLLVLLHFSVKGACRALGIPLATAGVFSYVIAVVGLNISSSQIGNLDLPSPLTPEMLTQIVEDFFAPASRYAIILSIAGLALIAFSFFWKGRPEFRGVKVPAGEPHRGFPPEKPSREDYPGTEAESVNWNREPPPSDQPESFDPHQR
jgi:hypothetical protein